MAAYGGAMRCRNQQGTNRSGCSCYPSVHQRHEGGQVPGMGASGKTEASNIGSGRHCYQLQVVNRLPC